MLTLGQVMLREGGKQA